MTTVNSIKLCVYMAGILEEIDDELEFDCSSQESTDSENEQVHNDVSLEPETGATNLKEFQRKSDVGKQSAHATRSSKNKSIGKEDRKNTK